MIIKPLIPHRMDNLYRLQHTYRKVVSRQAKRLGIHFLEWHVLAHLQRNRPELTKATLHRLLNLDGAHLTRLLDGLVKRGWIRKKISPRDKRVQLVTLLRPAYTTVRQIEHLETAFEKLFTTTHPIIDEVDTFIEQFKRLEKFPKPV